MADPPRRGGGLSAVAAAAVLLAGCAARHDPGAEGAAAVPPAEREFRAVWVATVDNIDWPSRPGLPADSQRVEAISLLDRSVELGLNAVILQVRPQCDALYASALEPWSYYLTGEQGQPPAPYYDPLQFWVEQAHARGLELHAWFNPYRAGHPKHRGPLAASSVVRQHPDWVRTLGDSGFLWLDPGLDDVRELTWSVILDVARRYDVDGVHLDDYFYPYPSYSDGLDFPDNDSWGAYRAGGGKLTRGDWRRDNVDRFVHGLHERLRDLGRPVKLGISPFGIWRPGHPASIEAGLDQHEMLYADARRWLREGWVDYYTPQLYWPISQVPQSFPVLLAWWTRNNPHGRHLWPGLYTSRVRPEHGWPAREITDQIMISRGLTPASPGHVHFSARVLLDTAAVGADGDTLSAALRAGPYRRQALVPATPWLDADAPEAPVATVRRGAAGVLVGWRRPAGEAPFHYVVYSERGGAGWSYQIVPAARTGVQIAQTDDEAPVVRVGVTAVDRMGNESQLRLLRLDAVPGAGAD